MPKFNADNTANLPLQQCGRSTAPFAHELYGEIIMCLIPHFACIHCAAALNGAPLLVTISLRQPHLHMISSYSQSAIDLAFSSFKGWASGQEVTHSWPCTIYLHPLEAGVICIIITCITSKILGVCITVGGILTSCCCCSWHKSHVLTNWLMSRSISSHQNLCVNRALVEKNPLCPLWSCTAVIIYVLFFLGTYKRCWLSVPLQYIHALYSRNLLASFCSRVYFLIDKDSGLYFLFFKNSSMWGWTRLVQACLCPSVLLHKPHFPYFRLRVVAPTQLPTVAHILLVH